MGDTPIQAARRIPPKGRASSWRLTALARRPEAHLSSMTLDVGHTVCWFLKGLIAGNETRETDAPKAEIQHTPGRSRGDSSSMRESHHCRRWHWRGELPPGAWPTPCAQPIDAGQHGRHYAMLCPSSRNRSSSSIGMPARPKAPRSRPFRRRSSDNSPQDSSMMADVMGVGTPAY